MRKIFCIFLSIAILSQPLLSYECCDPLREAQEEMNDLYRKRGTYDDPIFEGVSSSMIGWGFVLFAGLGLLAGFIHQSKGNTSSSTTPSSGS